MSIVTAADYSELLSNVKISLRQGGGSRASVFYVQHNGYDLVVKDYHACSGYFRNTLAPLLIAREEKKLKQLANVDCVPLWIASWKNVLVMEYRKAKPPVDANFTEATWQSFESKLYQAIEEMHQAGVAHADLRSPGNVIVTDDFEPIIIDFVASLSKPRAYNFPLQYLYNRICRIDKTAVLKIKKFVMPELLTKQEWSTFENDKSRGKWLRMILDNGRKFFQK